MDLTQVLEATASPGKHQDVLLQGVVIPIGAVVTAATGVKKRSRGQGLFLVSVKRSRIFSNLVTAVKILTFCACVLHIV